MALSEFEDSWEDQRVGSALLNVPIGDLRPKSPVCVAPDTPIRHAVERMNAVKAGCVLVTRDGQLAGILTERDILRHVVGKLDVSGPVEPVMTPDPQTVPMDAGVAFALHKMHVGGYRHIPVVDAAGAPVGVASVRDFVGFIVSLFPKEVLNLPPEPELGIARTAEGA